MSTRLEKMTNALEHTEKKLTLQEYADNLTSLQKTATRLIMGKDFETGMRLEEAIVRMEFDARRASLLQEEQVMKGIKAIKTIEKETRICKAGLGAEKEVTRALNHVTRPNTITYQNVYVYDGEEESELDDVVLTNEGIIILEVKSTKENITLTKDGRLVRGDNECYGKVTMGEKMICKRKLLQKMLDMKRMCRQFVAAMDIVYGEEKEKVSLWE